MSAVDEFPGRSMAASCPLAHLGADRGALPVVEGWGLLGLLASW